MKKKIRYWLEITLVILGFGAFISLVYLEGREGGLDFARKTYSRSWGAKEAPARNDWFWASYRLLRLQSEIENTVSELQKLAPEGVVLTKTYEHDPGC